MILDIHLFTRGIMMKFNLKAVLALLVSVIGFLSHPEILGLLPEKVAIIITALGMAMQAFAQQIARHPVNRVDD
jgi:hypothetical protein